MNYQCEICNEIYSEDSLAIKCEGKGEEIPLAEVGDLVSRAIKWVDKEHDYKDAIVSKIEKRGHHLMYYFEDRWTNTTFNILSNEGFLDNIKFK
jgi:hypothetical protein